MKTRIEWLNELPDGYRERALANCVEERRNDECFSMTVALYGVCDWSKTPEGFDFWSAVTNNYHKGFPLPPLPSGNSEKPNTHSVNHPKNDDAKEVGYDFVNPQHYKASSKEVWEMMVDIWGVEAYILHCEMCAFKYRQRLGLKPDQPIERDLQKARWYEEKAKELRG